MEISDFLIAELRGYGHLQYREDGEQMQAANARLIAAAPELYEALRDLFEAVVIPEEISIEAGCKARIRARDILLKLRGEEGGENA